MQTKSTNGLKEMLERIKDRVATSEYILEVDKQATLEHVSAKLQEVTTSESLGEVQP